MTNTHRNHPLFAPLYPYRNRFFARTMLEILDRRGMLSEGQVDECLWFLTGKVPSHLLGEFRHKATKVANIPPGGKIGGR